MIVERSIRIAAPADETYRRCIDIPFVGTCLPGATDVEPDGAESYRGRFAVKVGPVAVSLSGTVRIVEADPSARTAVLRLQGADRRIGGEVVGDLRIGVSDDPPGDSRLDVHTDVSVSGKLGQFGQAVILKKADQITEGFVQEFSRQLAAGPQDIPVLDGAPVPAVPAPAGEVAHPAPPDAAGPHAITALLRQGRRLALLEPGARLGGPGIGGVWMTEGSEPARRTVARVVELTVASGDELVARLPRLGVPAPAALAIVPRGAAVGDPDALTQLGRIAAGRGLPVLLVARTPWAALPTARAAVAAGAQGVTVRLDGFGETAHGLLALAVDEIRAAGLQLPLVVGPVPDGPAAAALLQRSADGVIVASTPRRIRALAAVRRRFPRP